MSASTRHTKIIAEIGINHNGDLEMCKRMISLAHSAGCDYAKLQKRNPDVCVPEHQKSVMRQTPWGEMTYLDYKKKIEFTEEQMRELMDYSRGVGIELFASVWDKDSVDVMSRLTNIGKIPSALITDLELCRQAREKFSTLLISTGMSTEAEIEACVEACDPDVIMHSNSTQPCPAEDLNLRQIEWLVEKYPGREIGQSGHEQGLVTTFVTPLLGAKWIERHITLNHEMWGSDQTSSIEPAGLFKLVKGIRGVEAATSQEPAARRLFPGEEAKRRTLRK